MRAPARRSPPAGSRRHRWLAPLLVLAGTLTVVTPAYVTWVLANPHALPVAHVEVHGDLLHCDRKALGERIRELTAGGFLTLDVHAVRDALEADPWIAAATVRRVWPNRIVIHLQEQVPVARWNEHSLVSRAGEVFTPPSLEGFESGWTRLGGPVDTAPQVLARWDALKARLALLGLGVEELELSERRAWQFRLAGGGPVVIVGRQQFEQRLERLLDTFATALTHGEVRIERIDLRYPNGFAVAFSDPLSLDPARRQAITLSKHP
jgi:cell division protein FtsQ